MNVPAYRRAVYRTLSIAPAKLGLRTVLKKTRTVNIYHAVQGFATEVGELHQGLLDYISGAAQLREEMKVNAREELGDLLYYCSVLAHELNAPKLGRITRLPGSGKKVKIQGTLTENLLRLQSIATDLLDATKKVMYGRDMDLNLLAERFNLGVTYIYAICYTLFGEPPAALMEQNIAKLLQRYPSGFSPEQEAKRDRKAEAAAAKAAGKPAQKPKAKKATKAKKVTEATTA